MSSRCRYLFCAWILFYLVGCNYEENNVAQIVPTASDITIVPTVSQTPVVTQVVTPTQNPILAMSEEELIALEEQNWDNREKIQQALMIEPTSGPKPYEIFDIEKKVEIGDVITMGIYTHPYNQKVDFSMRFPIKWIVLEKENGKALVLSLYNIDVMPFTDSQIFIESGSGDWSSTWETSGIRTWLNETFYYLAFDDNEEACILPTKIDTSDNVMYGTDGGGDTIDYLFLLSVDEVQRYFTTNEERRTQIIPDVEMEDLLIHDGEYPRNTTDYYDWWLRSPGETNEKMVCVGRSGAILMKGEWTTCEEVSVRPAMWIDLEKVKEIGLGMEE